MLYSITDLIIIQNGRRGGFLSFILRLTFGVRGFLTWEGDRGHILISGRAQSDGDGGIVSGLQKGGGAAPFSVAGCGN